MPGEWELYYETDGETDKPQVELDRFRYQDFERVLFDDGTTLMAPMDPFQETRRAIGLRMLDHFAGGVEGWNGKDARGHTTGHVAFEVQRGKWLMGSATVNLGQFWVWTSLYPEGVTQDIAMLSLVSQIDAWERGKVAAVSRSDVNRAVSGCRKQLLARVERPGRPEQAEMIMRNLRRMGVDTNDWRVKLRVYDDVWNADDPFSICFDDDW